MLWMIGGIIYGMILHLGWGVEEIFSKLIAAHLRKIIMETTL